MFVRLIKNNDPVCDLFLGCLSLAGIFVYKMNIINQDLMPFPYIDLNKNDEQLKQIFASWLESRAISNSDQRLDEIILRTYHLNPMHYGRMYNYQYLGAFMAYMLSSEDNYWINPTHPQLLTFGLVDPHWIKGYVINPATDINEAKILGNDYKECLKDPF